MVIDQWSIRIRTRSDLPRIGPEQKYYIIRSRTENVRQQNVNNNQSRKQQCARWGINVWRWKERGSKTVLSGCYPPARHIFAHIFTSCLILLPRATLLQQSAHFSTLLTPAPILLPPIGPVVATKHTPRGVLLIT